jgi:acyl-CoA thioesterase
MPIPEFEELEPGLKQKILEFGVRQIPFWTVFGMKIDDVRKGWARLRVTYQPQMANANGVAHGAIAFALADSAVGTAMVGHLVPGERISTVEMKINYIRPFQEGEITAEARIVHKGTQTAVGEVEVTDGRGQLVAKALATYAVFASVMEKPGWTQTLGGKHD